MLEGPPADRGGEEFLPGVGWGCSYQGSGGSLAVGHRGIQPRVRGRGGGVRVRFKVTKLVEPVCVL